MHYETTFEWSAELARRGARRFLWRHSRRRITAYFVLTASFAVAALTIEGGDVFWWVVGALVVSFGFDWYRYFCTAAKAGEDMPDHRITVRLEPESITFQTTEALSTVKWSRIKKLWRFPDVLLIFTYGSHSYSVLPVASLGENLQQFLENKVREYGGEIV